MWYCSRECQTSHWSLHRVDCKTLESPTDAKAPALSAALKTVEYTIGLDLVRLRLRVNDSLKVPEFKIVHENLTPTSKRSTVEVQGPVGSDFDALVERANTAAKQTTDNHLNLISVICDEMESKGWIGQR